MKKSTKGYKCLKLLPIDREELPELTFLPNLCLVELFSPKIEKNNHKIFSYTT